MIKRTVLNVKGINVVLYKSNDKSLLNIISKDDTSELDKFLFVLQKNIPDDICEEPILFAVSIYNEEGIIMGLSYKYINLLGKAKRFTEEACMSSETDWDIVNIDVQQSILEIHPDDEACSCEEMESNTGNNKENEESGTTKTLTMQRRYKIPSFSAAMDVPLKSGDIYMDENNSFYLVTTDITACEFFTEVEKIPHHNEYICNLEQIKNVM